MQKEIYKPTQVEPKIERNKIEFLKKTEVQIEPQPKADMRDITPCQTYKQYD
jgi:hypothetical protein